MIWSYRAVAPAQFAHPYTFSGLCPHHRTCRRQHCPFFHHAFHTPVRTIERMRVTFEEDEVTDILILDAGGEGL